MWPICGPQSLAEAAAETAGPQDVTVIRDSESEDAALLSRASGALGWSFLNTVVGRFGPLAIGILLARLLGPEEFGTFAVATVAMLAVLSFNELGVSLAIVRWPGNPNRIAPTVTTISVATSILIASASYLAAPGFAAAMGAPDATPVVRVMLLSIVIDGLVATPAALMQRNFQQSRRMIIDQVNVWVGALTSMGLALAGNGAMSLALGRIAGSVLAGILFVALSPERYRFGFDRTIAVALLKFGLPLAGASIIVFVVGYLDQMAVGWMLGPVFLGLYVLGYNLASWPVSIFSQPLRAVAPAAFARLQGQPELMRSTLNSVAGLLAAVALPVCMVAAGAAESIVTFIYGTAWSDAAQALRFLAIGAVFRILFELLYDYLVVLNRSRALLAVQLLHLCCLIPALILGGQVAGMAGIAAAQVLVYVVAIFPAYLFMLARVGVAVRALLRRLALPSAAGIVLGALALFVANSVESTFWSTVTAGLLVLAGVGVLVFADRGQLANLRMFRRAGTAA